MAKFEIYDILYENYKNEFHSLDYFLQEKYGVHRKKYEFNSGYPTYDVMTKDEFDDRLESDIEFNEKWYKKI